MRGLRSLACLPLLAAGLQIDQHQHFAETIGLAPGSSECRSAQSSNFVKFQCLNQTLVQARAKLAFFVCMDQFSVLDRMTRNVANGDTRLVKMIEHSKGVLERLKRDHSSLKEGLAALNKREILQRVPKGALEIADSDGDRHINRKEFHEYLKTIFVIVDMNRMSHMGKFTEDMEPFVTEGSPFKCKLDVASNQLIKM